jgi:NAD(P)-dependent dehydrogenase (short-subunit alcohol dehydrogenase family)
MTEASPLDLVPDLTGFVVLVTGGHSGLCAPPNLSNVSFSKSLTPIPHRGLATTKALAVNNATVYIASRSISKAELAIEGIKADASHAKANLIEMDLSDLSSVKRGAEEFMK